MKNKLMFLIGEGLKRKIKTKSFKITNLILLIIIPLLVNIDTVIEYFGGDFTTPTEVYVIDETEKVYDLFKNSYENGDNFSLSQTDATIKESDKTRSELENEIKENESKNIILYIKNDKENIFNAELISYDEVDTFLHQNLITHLNNVKVSLALENSSISTDEINKIYNEVTVEKIYLNELHDDAKEIIKNYGFTLIPIFIIPFFLIVILVIQMIGAEINEEKTSKSMEIIISSVSPKTHFISKMVTINIFVIMQSILILIYGFIGLYIRTLITGSGVVESFGLDINSTMEIIKNSGLINEILISIPFIILLFILSIIAYSLLAGILASMTTSIEDFQQLQTPLMILVLVGYYLALMASSFENSSFITIFSVIPFISAMLAPVLLVVGQIGLVEIIISVVLLLVVIFLFIKYGIRVYKVGILNYSTSKLWSKVFKALKEK